MLRRLILAACLVVPLLAVGGTAQAAACSGRSGVTVIVQFSGSTVSACAPGDPASGFAALKAAGFSVTFVNGQAFVCKINAKPSNAICGHTPPSNAYWAYFHAKRGGKWSYGNQGAASANPAPGSVEGWRFGSGHAPSTPPPPALSASKPKPEPTPRPTPKPSPTATSQSAPTSGSGAAATSPTPRAGTTAGTETSEPSAAPTKKLKSKGARTGSAPSMTSSVSPRVSPSPAVASATTSPAAAEAASLRKAAADPQEQGGVAWWWGLVALAVLGGAAGAVTLARRG